MLRLFVAVELPPQALAACEAVTRALRARLGARASDVRFPHAEGLHFTLQFLGAVEEERVPELEAGLVRATFGLAPFLLGLGGLQAFPEPRRPRVIYLGTTTGGHQLASLASAVGRELSGLGFAPDPRGFTPHVTLARVQAPQAGRVLAGALGQQVEELARFEVTELALMNSVQGAGGSRYAALARTRLAG